MRVTSGGAACAAVCALIWGASQPADPAAADAPRNPRLSILFISVPVYATWVQNRGMESRLNFYKAAPGAMKAMRGIEEYIHSTGLEGSLIELVKMRASQINGCAYCLD